MPKTAGVLRQEIYFTDNSSKHNPNPYIQSKPNNHRNKKNSQSYLSYFWNQLPTLPRAGPNETIGFTQAPGEIYDATKYCCTAIYNILAKNLEKKNARDDDNPSWVNRCLNKNNDINPSRRNRPRPRDWRNVSDRRISQTTR